MSQKSKAKILIMSTDNETASKMWEWYKARHAYRIKSSNKGKRTITLGGLLGDTVLCFRVRPERAYQSYLKMWDFEFKRDVEEGLF